MPINYNSINFVFENEEEVVMKEDLYYNGAITVNRGSDFQKHFLDRFLCLYINCINFLNQTF
jgi:hypothetical protein